MPTQTDAVVKIKVGHTANTHMIASEFGVACNANLNDGAVHAISANFDEVTCKPCRVEWTEYMLSQYKDMWEHEKSKNADLEQINAGQHRLIVQLRTRRDELNNRVTALTREREELAREQSEMVERMAQREALLGPNQSALLAAHDRQRRTIRRLTNDVEERNDTIDDLRRCVRGEGPTC